MKYVKLSERIICRKPEDVGELAEDWRAFQAKWDFQGDEPCDS